MIRATARGLLVMLALGSAPSGCRDATAARLRFRSDVPWSQGRSVLITAASTGDKLAGAPPSAVVDTWSSGDLGDLVLLPSGDSAQRVSVRAVLGVTKDASQCTEAAPEGCIFARRQLAFVEHRALELPITLAAACTGVACDEDSTCNALGKCVRASIDTSACGPDGCTLPDEGTTAQATDVSCRHLHFDQGWVEVPPSPDLDLPGPATLEAWVSYDAVTPLAAEQHVISHHHHGTNRETQPQGYLFMVWGTAADLGAGVRFYNPGRDCCGESLQIGFGKHTVVTPSAWTHIAASTDGVTARLYVNGELKGTSVLPSPPTAAAYPGPLRIGASSEDERFFFAGKIDELRISRADRYPQAFTPARTPFVADDGTVALYHFDEAHGDVAVDASGRGHHGTIQGTVQRGEDACP